MSIWDKFKKKGSNGPVDSKVISSIIELYGNQVKYSETDYLTMAREGYQNFILFSSLNHIVNAFNQLDFKVVKVDKDGNQEVIPNHPITKLINKPNPYQGKSTFNEAMIKYLWIGGEVFINKVETTLSGPKELYALRPDRTKIQFGTDASQPIVSFEYGEGNQPIDPQDIAHIKFFNPTDIYNGLGSGQSGFQPAAKITDTINAGIDWNAAMMQNSGRPSGAFVAEESLTDPQFERLKDEIKANVEGAKNAGKTLVLDGGVTWQEIFVNQKDADWVEGMKLIMRQQSVAMNVPSILNGDTESTTYSNYKEARKALYMDAVIPLGNYVLEEYNIFFENSLNDGEIIIFTTDHILALQEDIDKVYRRANEAGPLTENEKRKIMGHDTVGGLNIVVTTEYLYNVDTKELFVTGNYIPYDALGLEEDTELVEEEEVEEEEE